jgi:hypothetical protein
MPKVLIELELYVSEVFSTEEFWGGEMAPTKPSMEDVLRVIAGAGGPRKILQDWDLLNAVSMEVTLRSDGLTEHATVDYWGAETPGSRSDRTKQTA